jgi:DNA-directed RNA polymerase specialized sigma24 family protein
MDRIAKLVTAAAGLRRMIWASLPLRVRLAEFITRMATSTTEAFGRSIYAEFLENGVQEMPAINGAPADSFDKTKKPIANRLPRTYGADFGSKCFRILMGKLSNPDTVEDVMTSWLVRFLNGGSKLIKPGTNLRQAEQYVLRALQNEAINWMRKKRELLEKADKDDEGGDGPSLYDRTPGGGEMDEKLVEKVLSRADLKHALAKVHPDAEQYLRLSMIEGYGDREIVGDPLKGRPSMLEHPVGKNGKPLNESGWSYYKPRIYKVLKEMLADELRP